MKSTSANLLRTSLAVPSRLGASTRIAKSSEQKAHKPNPTPPPKGYPTDEPHGLKFTPTRKRARYLSLSRWTRAAQMLANRTADLSTLTRIGIFWLIEHEFLDLFPINLKALSLFVSGDSAPEQLVYPPLNTMPSNNSSK